MANKDVNKALDVVDLTYDELIVIANDIYISYQIFFATLCVFARNKR